MEQGIRRADDVRGPGADAGNRLECCFTPLLLAQPFNRYRIDHTRAPLIEHTFDDGRRTDGRNRPSRSPHVVRGASERPLPMGRSGED